MVLLLLSIAVLILGPVAYGAGGRQRAFLGAVDGFVFVAIAGLVLLAILPDALSHGGWSAAVFLVAGGLGPTVSERISHAAGHRGHTLALVLGLIGIGVHGMLDGAALVTGEWHTGGVLPFAVVLHRFPAGLAVWWLLRPTAGARVASAVIGLVILSTIAGYLAGPTALQHVSPVALAWFEAFVGGALLHVVVHRPHDHEPRERRSIAEGIGAIAGVALVVLLVAQAGRPGADHAGSIGGTFLSLAMESAPALLLAYLAAGFLSVLVPSSSVAWLRRGGPFRQALRGMTIGLPLPICSCGVVPLYRTLILRGVPLAAAMAFLVATPELGLDAIFLSIPLLGGTMTIVRVVAAIVVALAVGWAVARLIGGAPGRPPLAQLDPPVQRPGVSAVMAAGLRAGFGEVVDNTAPWILLGLAIAAVAAPLMEGGMLAGLPAGVDVLVFSLLGLPIYVCASAATPMVAVLLAGGVSPGAALAFLLTGPATNVTTFGILTRLHGRKTALAFSGSIMTMAVILGVATNLILPRFTPVPLSALTAGEASPVDVVAGILLAAAFLASLARRGARDFVGEILPRKATPRGATP